MRRFDYDENEDYQDGVDNFFDEEDEDFEDVTPEWTKAMVEEDIKIQQLHVSLAYRELNDRLLANAIQVVENSFWWKFYSLSTRLKMISQAYETLKTLEES